MLRSSLSTWLPQAPTYKAIPSAGETSDNRPDSTSKPSIQHVLSSRRVRLVAMVALLTFALYILAPHLPRVAFVDPDTASQPDWSRFAYSQYATNTAYLCNALMMFEALHRLGSKADRIVMYPDNWDITDGPYDLDSLMLKQARDRYGAKLYAVKVQDLDSNDTGSTTWSDSFTKLLAFNHTEYDRVLGLDSDGTLLEHMDDLFLLPSTPIALPRRYWSEPEERQLSTVMILLEPSEIEMDRILHKTRDRKGNQYDMDIVNDLYRDNAMVLPHRDYVLLSGEFRSTTHQPYLGNDFEPWDADQIFNKSRYIHFSDWPVPKPWVKTPEAMIDKMKPPCRTGARSCRDQDIWLWLYQDFIQRRIDICRLGPEPPHVDLHW